MKKFVIILLLCKLLTATLFGSQPQNPCRLSRSLFNGLVQSRIEFSKEEYNIGDLVEVTIYFELVVKKNSKNLQLAITDYSKNIFYLLRHDHLGQVTQQEIEVEQEYLGWKKRFLSLKECDSDLILSNINPKGKYHLKFRLLDSAQIGSLDRSNNFIYERLYLFLYKESITYNYITDFQTEAEEFLFCVRFDKNILKNSYSKQEAKEVYRGKYIRENYKNELNVSKVNKTMLNDEIFVMVINDYISDLHQLAVTAQYNDNFKKAEELYKSFINDYPDNGLAVRSASSLYWIVGKIDKADESFIDLQKYYYKLIDQYPNTRLAEKCEEFTNDCNRAIGDYLPAIYWYENRIYNSKSFTDSMYAVLELKSMYHYIGKKMPRELVNPKFEYDINKWVQESSKLQDIILEHQLQELEKNKGKYENLVKLYSNKPEPFDNETIIRIKLYKTFHINLKVYDSEDSLIKILMDEELQKGDYNINWNGADEKNKAVPNGKYYYELTVNGKKKERIDCTLLK